MAPWVNLSQTPVGEWFPEGDRCMQRNVTVREEHLTPTDVFENYCPWL
jgi:hypothetical protein